MTDISFSNFMDRKSEVPPPVEWDLAQMDFKNVGGAELTPLTDDDIATHSRDDVAKELERMKKSGYNPTRLGEPMTDAEFNKFFGQT